MRVGTQPGSRANCKGQQHEPASRSARSRHRSLAIADTNVNHGVETTNSVDLLRNLACAGDGGETTDDDRLGLRRRPADIVSAREFASAENDLMALLDEQIDLPSDPAPRTILE
jgi:hypothetical protein